MFLQKCIRRNLVWREWRFIGTVSKDVKTTNFSKYLDISKSEAEYMCLKYPTMTKLSEHEVKGLLETISELGYSKDVFLKQPLLFSILPITLKYRHQVLSECGIQNVTAAHLVSYLPLVKQKAVRELKLLKMIPASLNIENRLANYMTQWPTSLTTLIYGDAESKTLYELRLKIIQRYLELVLELTEDEFDRGVKTYPTIKHRPLAVINETLTLLQSSAMMPLNKIKNNLYLVHGDPANIKNILFKFRTIGGIDIKEIIRMYPKILMKNYDTLIEMRKVLKSFEISDEAQVRCFEIYTLSPETVKERLRNAKEIPEFQALFNHPRFLRMIYYNNTAMKRLRSLYNINKKCLSLNVLAGCSQHYKLFEKTPGDRSGKGKDLIFCLSQLFGKDYSSVEIRKSIKRHPYWINVPIVHVKYVYEKLSVDFTAKDIYDNCTILLYPWDKIKTTLNHVSPKKSKNQSSFTAEQVDHLKLSKTQILSLVLYLLEKKHYFSGNGVWTEEQIKNVIDLTPFDDMKHVTAV